MRQTSCQMSKLFVAVFAVFSVAPVETRRIDGKGRVQVLDWMPS